MHFWNWICSYYHVLRFVDLDTVLWTAHFASAVLCVWFEILLCVVNFMWNLCERTVCFLETLSICCRLYLIWDLVVGCFFVEFMWGNGWFLWNHFELGLFGFDLRSYCGLFIFCGIYVGERYNLFETLSILVVRSIFVEFITSDGMFFVVPFRFRVLCIWFESSLLIFSLQFIQFVCRSAEVGSLGFKFWALERGVSVVIYG